MTSRNKTDPGKTALDQIRASLRQFLRIRDLQQKLDPHTGEPGRPLASDELKHWRDSLSQDMPRRSRAESRGSRKD
jgi:hypothetical protein